MTEINYSEVYSRKLFMGEITLPRPTCNIHIVGVKSIKMDDLCMTPHYSFLLRGFYCKIIIDKFGMSPCLI